MAFIYIIISIILYGGWGFLQKIAINRVGSMVYFVTSLTLGCCIYPFLLIMQKINTKRFFPDDGIGILLCLLTAVCSILASISYAHALKTLPAGLVAVLVALSPLVTLALSYAFLGELVPVIKLFGLVLIIIGLVILSS